MTYRALNTLCVFFLFLSFMLTGCEYQNDSKKIITEFTSDFTADYNEMTVKGTITINCQGLVDMNISYPKSLSSLQIGYKNSEVHILLDGLECSADEAYLTSNSFASIVNGLFKELNRLNNTEILKESCSININGSDYLVIIDENGAVKEIKSSKGDFIIEFFNYKTLNE